MENLRKTSRQNFLRSLKWSTYESSPWSFSIPDCHVLKSLKIWFHLQLGSSLSIYGCRKYNNGVGGFGNIGLDAERGTYVAPSLGETSETSNLPKNLPFHEEHHADQTAGLWTYIFQIIFQVYFSFISVCIFWISLIQI